MTETFAEIYVFVKAHINTGNCFLVECAYALTLWQSLKLFKKQSVWKDNEQSVFTSCPRQQTGKET